jgi:hypothetical protein
MMRIKDQELILSMRKGTSPILAVVDSFLPDLRMDYLDLALVINLL